MNHIPIHTHQFIKWNAHILTFLMNIFIWLSGCSGACSHHMVILCSKRVSTRVRERFRLLGVTFGSIHVLSTWFTPALYFDNFFFSLLNLGNYLFFLLQMKWKKKYVWRCYLRSSFKCFWAFQLSNYCGNDKNWYMKRNEMEKLLIEFFRFFHIYSIGFPDRGNGMYVCVPLRPEVIGWHQRFLEAIYKKKNVSLFCIFSEKPEFHVNSFVSEPRELSWCLINHIPWQWLCVSIRIVLGALVFVSIVVNIFSIVCPMKK